MSLMLLVANHSFMMSAHRVCGLPLLRLSTLDLQCNNLRVYLIVFFHRAICITQFHLIVFYHISDTGVLQIFVINYCILQANSCYWPYHLYSSFCVVSRNRKYTLIEHFCLYTHGYFAIKYILNDPYTGQVRVILHFNENNIVCNVKVS